MSADDMLLGDELDPEDIADGFTIQDADDIGYQEVEGDE